MLYLFIQNISCGPNNNITLYIYTYIHILFSMSSHFSASLLRASVVANCPSVFLWERQTSLCNILQTGTNSSFYTGHQTDIRQGTLLSDRLLHGLSKAAACQCLDLLYGLVRPRISFICDFRRAFWRQKLFSWLVALNAGLRVSVEYSSPFNDFCPVTYRVLFFSWCCNKMIFPSLVLSSYYCTFKFCFVGSVLSW